ncbi:MAG: VWA domain-containing protein, partial [Candidatus Eiseniibacteriota bacterium]
MIRWARPDLLVLGLALVVVLVLMLTRYERRRRWALESFAGRLAGALSSAEPDGQRRLRWGLRIAALALLVVAAAGPRWGEEVVKVTSQGSDIVFVFDVSRSMDARDVPPSRLDEARREALSVLDGLAGDRVGVVAFAGDAVALSPLTLDASAVRLLIETLGENTISTPGSDLGRGLRAALRVLPEGDASEQAIVLFTDGEDLEGGLQTGGVLVQRRGVRVFAVGVGTPGGETIPLLDPNGLQIGVKQDANGQPVISRLDSEGLRELARRTRGQYFAADHPGGELRRLKAALGTVGRGAREGRLGSRVVERFWWFALLAWILLVVSWLLPERWSIGAWRREAARTPPARGIPRSRAALVPLVAGGLTLLQLFVPLAGVRPARAEHPLVEGNRLYQKGDFRGAARVYQEALRKRPDDPALLTNLGSALYRLGQYRAAEEAFARARSKKPSLEGQAAYGRGDAQFRQERYREALSSFREALEKRPRDADARFNYELTLRKLRAEEEKRNPPEPEPNPEQQNPGGGGGGGGGGG